jgi:endonuclease-3
VKATASPRAGRASAARWTARDIAWLIARLRRHRAAVRSTTLAEVESDRDPFRLLIACVVSLRTKDVVTAQASRRLFEAAATPSAVSALAASEIARLIFPAGFYNTKAGQIHSIALELLRLHDGRVPADRDALLKLPGVGRKTANLVLGLGFGIPAICVDTHVHHISNRLGLVSTRSPEQTEQALEAILSRRYWIEINDLLVTFGQNVCHPTSPRCSRCPVTVRCRRVGVERSR